MVENIVNVLLGLFLLANGGVVYERALANWRTKVALEEWISFSIGAIFLVGPALLVYALGTGWLASLAKLVQ